MEGSRFLDYITRQLVQAWIEREPAREVPWTVLRRPLAASTVALVSTAGLALAGDRPFDTEGERRDPWWGDPTFRRLPREARSTDIRSWHLHIDPAFVAADANCAFPLDRLLALERDGVVGRAAPTHYSYMGYILRPERLLAESVPAIIGQMRAEQVDTVLLAPY